MPGFGDLRTAAIVRSAISFTTRHGEIGSAAAQLPHMARTAFVLRRRQYLKLSLSRSRSPLGCDLPDRRLLEGIARVAGAFSGGAYWPTLPSAGRSAL